MIKKERLEELIEQGATIWKVPYGTPIETKLHKYSYVCNELKLKEDYLMEYDLIDCHYIMGGILSRLFETKEDAEEYAEFGNITRTERLELPMWEEACDGVTHNVPFTTPNHLKIEMLICDEHIDIISIYNSIMDYSKPLTRENYDEARRLCVKLFKGESNE